jgi:hypothetical protein
LIPRSNRAPDMLPAATGFTPGRRMVPNAGWL